MSTILHLIPSLEGGGAERQLSMLAREQARRGWGVHIALRRRGIYHDVLRQNGITIHELGDLRRAHPLLFVRIANLVRQLDPTVIQTWLEQMDVIGGLVAMLGRRPWIMTERTTGEAYARRGSSRWARAALGRHADGVVANSRQGALYWRDRHEFVSIVPNALELEAVRSCPFQQDFTDELPLVLFVGRLTEYKAPGVLVEALGRLVGTLKLQAAVIGDGPLQASLVNQIRAHGLADRIMLLPYQRNWWGWLKVASLLVSPSVFEGHPNVVLEAMAARCPVVVSDIAAHREVLDETCGTFFRCHDSGALADAIALVLANRTRARLAAERAYGRVQSLTVVAAADAYERVYRAAIPGMR